MTIAFYAPMKPPTHRVPSGDRRMARLLMQAWQMAGHTVELASSFRSFDRGDAHRQMRIKNIGERLAARLIRRYRSRLAVHRPKAWFTYHLYHKAPDWIGPLVSEALGIPYIVAEASYAPKQAGGRWDLGHRATAQALRQSNCVLGFNPDDEACLAPMLGAHSQQKTLAPFINTDFYDPNQHDCMALKRAFAARHNLDPTRPWLLTVAMMRDDQKQDSYALLAQALDKIQDQPWHLLVVGSGPAEASIRSRFSAVNGRVTWLGIQDSHDLRDLYAATDLFVWPAIKEAYGMVFLEALSSGLPVVAGRSAGVANIVRHEHTGLLVAQGDVHAFADAVSRLLDAPALRRNFARCARTDMLASHSLGALSATLGPLLQNVLTGGAA